MQRAVMQRAVNKVNDLTVDLSYSVLPNVDSVKYLQEHVTW